MSRPLYYYAKINENNVCYGFETLTKKFKEEELPSNLIPLPDYNESVLWRRWDKNLKAWSSEAYEPSVEVEFQEKIDQLETDSINLTNEVEQMKKTDIDWGKRQIRVTGKGNKERIVYFDTICEDCLRKYFMSRLDDCNAVFVIQINPIKFSGRRSIQREIKKITKQSDLNINENIEHEYRKFMTNY